MFVGILSNFFFKFGDSHINNYYLCVCGLMCLTCLQEPPEARVGHQPELELWVVVSHLIVGLRNQSFARAVSSPNHCTVSHP